MIATEITRSELDSVGIDIPVGQYSAPLSMGEQKILEIPEPMAPSEWAEKFRVVTVSSVPGKWRNETSPYLAGIMDASFFESVETVTVCAAPQTGKSEFVNNCAGYAIDKAPGNMLFIYPDELTARDNVKDRIGAMIESSPRLRKYMTGVDDDVSFSRINLRHLQIYTGWARSASRLANKPLPYVILEETDKYPLTAGKKETGPIELAEKRTRTYRSMRKIWKISTPTIEAGEIWQAFMVEASVRFDFWVKCPACDESQRMVFDRAHFKFPDDVRDPERINQEDLAWYECDFCHDKWDDETRNEAVRRGQWRTRLKGDDVLSPGRDLEDLVKKPPADDEDSEETEERLELFEYLKAYRPKKIAFHIPSWLSYFVTLSEVAMRFLKGTRDRIALKDFMNSDCAEPWLAYRKEREESTILALADDRPRGLVPGGGVVAALTAAVDTQKFGFWYEVRAWGWGLERESWGIREGFVPTFEALEDVLWHDEYLDSDGVKYIVALTVQDAMGEKTSEVYDFCRVNRGRILPLKGEQRMNQPFAYSNLEYYPGKKKPIPGGLVLLRVNTTYYKNLLSNKLEIAGADRGAWHYHSEISDAWALQMTAEYVDDNGLWVPRPNMDNHAWDISGYQWAANDVLGIPYWKREAMKPKAARRGPPPAVKKSVRERDHSSGIKRPKWMEDR